MTGIAAWLPDADVVTCHETAVPIAPDRALVLTLALPAAPDRLVQALIRLRGRPTAVIGGFHEWEAEAGWGAVRA